MRALLAFVTMAEPRGRMIPGSACSPSSPQAADTGEGRTYTLGAWNLAWKLYEGVLLLGAACLMAYPGSCSSLSFVLLSGPLRALPSQAPSGRPLFQVARQPWARDKERDFVSVLKWFTLFSAPLPPASLSFPSSTSLLLSLQKPSLQYFIGGDV